MSDLEKNALNGMSWGAQIGGMVGGTIPGAIIGTIVGAMMGDKTKEQPQSALQWTENSKNIETQGTQNFNTTPKVHWDPK